MGNGDNADDNAAATNLRLLHYLRTHPVTGPEGHSFVSSASRATSTGPGIPYNTDVVDHIRSCVTEIAADTRAANPDAGPLPERVDAVYAWCLENTQTAAHAQQQRRDTIIYRQTLEHHIALGEVNVIRPHRCPECRTFGLMWSPPRRRVLCTNRKCLSDEGTANTFDLARLAYEHVAQKNYRQVRAT